jgi:enamine deaminase RidA (YjgF/YER057c/UK114 family)
MAKEQQAFHLYPEIEKSVGYTQAILAGDTLYMSGMISVDEKLNLIGAGDMRLQAQTVYEILQRVLQHHDMTLKNVVKETVFVTDIAAMANGRSARAAAYASAGAYPPASSMVEVKGLFLAEAMIEVEMIAVR